MRETLLAAVRARTAQAIETDDSRPVLAPDAMQEADALLARVLGPAVDPDEPVDLEALHALGWLYWQRVQMLPVGEWDDDLQLALMVLEPVYAADPEAVPELLRTFYEEETPPGSGPQGGDQAERGSPADYTGQGGLLYEWYERTGDLDALQAAVRVFRATLAAVPDEHPKRGICLSNLHTAVSSLAERTGDMDAVRETVNVGRAMLEATADDDPEYVDRVNEVGLALESVFEHTGDMEMLREAVRLARDTVTATPDDGLSRAVYLTNLGRRLHKLFEHTGEAEALREAVAAGRSAVATLPADDPERATCLSNLGTVLRLSFGETGDLATLHEAVAVTRAAVEATADDDPGRAGPLTNLNGVLEVLYEHTGDVDAVREAVTVGRAAVAATPAGHPDHPMALANLGVSLRELFEHTGDVDLLHEAAAAHRAAVAATPDRHLKRASRLTNLGNTLLAVYDRTGDLKTLREVLAAGRDAVAEIPEDHPLWAGSLSNLGIGLLALFDKTGDVNALRQAVAAGRAALAATPADHPLHARYLSNLGVTLSLLSDETGDADALREAVAASRAAVAVTPDADYLTGLAAALRKTFEQTGDQESLSQARAALARAAESPTAAVTDRIRAGRLQAQADALAGDHSAALAAMETVVSLLPQVASRELRRADRAHRLGEVAGIGAGAAAAALRVGRADRAVELLEQARGLLLAETMDARTDQARLRAHAPDLADQFTHLRDHLAYLETAPSPGGSGLLADAPDLDRARRLADQRREAAAEWNTLLDRIRARPRLADFLTPPPVDRLRPQAEPGPIVIVSTDAGRCDALVLTADSDKPVRHIPLTDLTQDTVYKQAVRFFNARRAAVTATNRAERKDAQAVLHEILAWLWDTTTGPILADLGYTRTPEPGRPWPRLWWCPVGGMTLLPLHAAGHHQDITTGAPQPRTVLDRVASSYTATIRALAYARQAPASPAPTTQRGPAVIVAMPDTPGAPSLPGASHETRRLTSLLPGATVLRGHRATHDAVTAALPRHAVAHFSCHGVSEWTSPDTSRLLLHDHTSHPLTVTAVSRLHLTHADLAYLSACSTTDTHPTLADEAVHITAAFQLAGYRNVIGTLWPIDDHTATRIAVDVYTRLTDHGTHPPHTSRTALALHHAIRRIRTDYLATPTLWAAHIHTGT